MGGRGAMPQCCGMSFFLQWRYELSGAGGGLVASAMRRLYAPSTSSQSLTCRSASHRIGVINAPVVLGTTVVRFAVVEPNTSVHRTHNTSKEEEGQNRYFDKDRKPILVKMYVDPNGTLGVMFLK